MTIQAFAALALGLAEYAAASGLVSAGRQSRPTNPNIIDFPAKYMRGFEGHNGKRQEQEQAIDARLQTTESWYWSENGQPIGNWTATAEDNNKRLLSAERFADAVSNTECGDDFIIFTFSDRAAYATAQESWTWMNEGAERSVAMVLDSGVCGNEQRQTYSATGVEFSQTFNSRIQRQNTTRPMQAVVMTSRSSWNEVTPRGIVTLDTRGLVSGPQATTIQRRQGATSDIGDGDGPNSISFDRANVQDRTLINFDPTRGDNSNPTPPKADGDNVPPSDLLPEDQRAPFYLGCRFCGLRGSVDIFSTIEVDFLKFPEVLQGSMDIIPRNLELEIRLELGLGFEIGFGGTVNPGDIDLGTISLGAPLAIAGVNFGPSIEFDFVSQVGPLEGLAGVNMAMIVDVPNNPVGRLDFGDRPERQSTGWEPRVRFEGPDLTGSLGFTASIGPRVRFQVGVEVDVPLVGEVGVTGGVQISAPRLFAEFQAEASTANTACQNSNVGVSARVGVDGPIEGFVDVNGNQITFPFANLITDGDILPQTCINVGGDEQQPTPQDPAAVAPVDPNNPIDPTAAPEGARPDGSVTVFPDTCCGDGTCGQPGTAGINRLPINTCTIVVLPEGVATTYKTTSNNLDTLCEYTYFSDTQCTQGVLTTNNDLDTVCLTPDADTRTPELDPFATPIVAMIMTCF